MKDPCKYAIFSKIKANGQYLVRSRQMGNVYVMARYNDHCLAKIKARLGNF